MSSAPNALAPRLAGLAVDLRTGFPRSPRATLGGYVIAARAVDKCRAMLLDRQGEYKFDCALDKRFFSFAEIDAAAFREAVAAGATDAEMAEWIQQHARKRPREEIVMWNNRQRETRLSDLPPETQVFMEDYIAKFVPAGRVVYRWFDVYDLEEKRL